MHGRGSFFFRASDSSVRQFFLRCGFGWFGLVSRWCLAVSHGLPRGWFLVWRCVLHGRVSSFFRASESSVKQFFCGAVLAGLGSCLGGVWLFRMGCRAFCTVEFHLSLGHQKAALGSFFAVRFGLVSRWCLADSHGWFGFSFFRASESSVVSRWCLAVSHGLPRAALSSFFAVRFWLVWARV